MTRPFSSSAVLALALVASCLPDSPAATFPCSSNAHCAFGYVCDLGTKRCVDAPTGTPPADGGELTDGGHTDDDAGPPLSDDDGGPDGGSAPNGDGGAPDAGLLDAGGGPDAGVNHPPTLLSLRLQCEEATPCPFTLDADDGETPGSLQGSVVSPPARGALSAFAGLDATYTPAVGAMGSDTFTVRVSDGDLESAEATVHVRVVSRRSCAHLLLSGGASDSGVHTLLPDGPGGPTLDVCCDMTREGGGWALALKADGRQQTFAYTAALWTDDTLLNPESLTLDDSEAKLAPFTDLEVGQVLVLMRDVATAWTAASGVLLSARASSLRQLFARDVNRFRGERR